MGGPEVERLIALLAKLPGLGPRSARRAALRLLQHPQTRMLPLAMAMESAARAVRVCGQCGNLDSADPCAVCADPARDRTLAMIFEKNSTRTRFSFDAAIRQQGMEPVSVH